MDIKKSNSNTIVVEKEKGHGFWRFFLFSIYIMILGAFGAVLADRAIFPRLSQMEFFKNSNFLKRAVENTTIINKTEQLVVPGDFLGQRIFEENKSSILEIKEIKKTKEIETKKSEEIGNQKSETASVLGFAVTQDGVIFSPNFILANSEKIEESKFIVRNFQGEEREAEMMPEKSDENVAAFKYSGEQLNIPVLSFADNIKPGEEAVIISQNSVITAFVKSVSENRILLNDYPDETMNGALVLNKNGKIIGMYRVIDDGEISSYVIPASVLKNKISEVLK